MSTTIDKSPSELQSSSDPNNPQIRKAFNFLKAHASAVASFTLQWQDLEDHLQSINNSIQSKLDEIQQSQKPQNTQLPKTKKSEPSSHKEHLSSTLQPLIDSKETKLNTTDSQLNTPKTQVKPDESLPAKVGANGIPVRDGKSLMDYLKKNLKEHESIREGVRHALKGLKDSGKVVLDAIKGFYPPGLKTGVVDPELSALRRSSVLLLEELINVRPLINGRVKEEASKLSSVWKSKMNLEMVNSMEVWGFLLLLNGYGLAGEYNMDEILNLVGTVVQRKQAPEMFRSLGFSDKASDFIQKLISQDKLIEAIRFIYAFELVDKFPPVPLLKAHLQEAKKVANSILKNSYNSSKLKDDAANKEIAAMRSVIRCIEDYKLESEFSPENLKEQIESLRKQKRERAPPTHSALAAKAQMQQQQSGQKRTLHDSKTQMKRQDNRSKHPRTVPTAGALNYSGRAPTTVQLHHRSAGGYEGERTDYLLQSDRMAAASNVSTRAAALQAMHHSAEGLFEGEGAEYYLSARMPTSGVNAAAPAPNPSFGASSNIYSIEASRYQPTASYTGQGTEYSSRYYNLARSILDLHTNLPSGSHGLTSSPPVTQQTNLAGGNYCLSNSNPETHHMSSAHYGLAGSGASTAHMNSSADLYGISVGTSGRRTEQFGSTGAVQAAAGITSNVSPHSNLAYYPGDPPLRAATYNDRPASSSSGYEMLSNRPYVFHL